MEFLGFEIPRAEIEAWIANAWTFSAPRLVESLGLLIVAAILFVVARWVMGRLNRRIAARTKTDVDDLAIALLRRVIVLSIGFWLLWRLGQVWEAPRVARFVVAVWIVVLTFPLGHFVGSVLQMFEQRMVGRTETTLDDTALPLLNKAIRFIVVAIGVLIALQYLGINVTPLLAGAGVMGLGISLAAKDTLSNLIAGVLLILDRPFDIGDRIELWGTPTETGPWGDVIEIGLRATTIRNPDNVVVIIPNNELMRRDIVNYTASGDHIRIRITFGIAYDADSQAAMEVILEAANAAEGVKPEPEPLVIVRRFSESSVDLELRVWIRDARQRRAIEDAIRGAVKEGFDAHGIEIPYPKRDIYVKTESG